MMEHSSRLPRGIAHARPKVGLLVGIVIGLAVAFVLPLASFGELAALFFCVIILGATLAMTSAPISELRIQQESPQIAADSQCCVIPGGRYFMGSQTGRGYPSERPALLVELPVFACMATPVTRRLFASVMGRDPGWPTRASGRLPANNVSWLDAIEFCNALSQLMDLTPCYEIRGDKVIWLDRDGYRLPTEAEWEYACRGGSWAPYCYGGTVGALPRYAWFEDNAGNRPRVVGRKLPNAWGLHDTHGNVWEWCWDEFSPHDQTRTGTGPGATRLASSHRVVRGGAFFLPAGALRSPVRRGEPHDGGDVSIGFRCVRGRHAWLTR